MHMTALDRLCWRWRAHQSCEEALPHQICCSNRLAGMPRIRELSTCFKTSRGHSLRADTLLMPAACNFRPAWIRHCYWRSISPHKQKQKCLCKLLGMHVRESAHAQG